MFKRNQIEAAIAFVLEPGSAKPSSEILTRIKRLLETDRGLGRTKLPPIRSARTSPSIAWTRRDGGRDPQRYRGPEPIAVSAANQRSDC